MKCNYDFNFNYHRCRRTSKEAKTFVSNLIQFDSKDRSTMEEALNSKRIITNEPTKCTITNDVTD